MLPTAPSPVKPAGSSLLQQQAIIWLTLGGAALLIWASGLDATLAQTLHQPQGSSPLARLAWAARQYSTLPGTILAVLGLIALVWPKLWRTRPTLYRTAVVLTLTAILGAGLFNQTIVKNLADRPRPRESVLIADAPTNTDAFHGKSMPSGHAAMGFVLAAPFFTIRRRKIAYAWLITGLAAGTAIGLARMALGAHFASDVLIAGAISLATSSLLAAALTRWQRVPASLLAAGAILGGFGFILGNHFTNLTLTTTVSPGSHIQLPCPVPPQPAVPATLIVTLSGYGAPLSNLQIIEKNGITTLQTRRGLYHSLHCTATFPPPPPILLDTPSPTR